MAAHIAALTLSILGATVAPQQPAQPLPPQQATSCPARQVSAAQATLASRLRSDPTHPLLLWCKRVMADPSAPPWKRGMAERAALGGAEKFTAKVTAYQPEPRDGGEWADSSTGGGSYPSWNLGRPLRDGDAAAWAGNRNAAGHPFGEVVFVASDGCSRIIADRGGAVNTYPHLDLCYTDAHDYRRARQGKFQAWILGRVGPEVAK